jgi:hypothetical protein
MNMSTVSAGATQTIRLRNNTGQEQELWIEPLGDRVMLLPNVLYEMTATDAFEEIDFSGDRFTVYGWVTRVSTVHEDGSSKTVWEIPSGAKV